MRKLSLMMIVACTAVLAAAPSAATPASSKNAKDPNEIVCEKQSIVGSRLATRKVCGTRAEWAEKRRLDKEAIDQGQRAACMPSHNGPGGQPAC